MTRLSALVLALAASLLALSSARAQDTIRVGWTIPAEESKYWMMRRPQEFPDLGKAYKVEWTQFQGTAPHRRRPAPRGSARGRCRAGRRSARPESSSPCAPS